MSQPPSDDNTLRTIFLVLMVWLGGLEKLGTLDFPPRCCIDLATRSGLLNASLGYKSADGNGTNNITDILRPLSEQMIQINVDINMCFYDSLVIIWALRYHHFTPDCTALIWKRNSKYMFYKGFWSPVKVMFCYYLVIVIPLSSAFPTMCSYRDLLCVKELWTRLSGSCMLINFSGKAKCGKYAYVVFNRSKHKHGCLLIHPVPGNSHFLEHDKYLNIYNR